MRTLIFGVAAACVFFTGFSATAAAHKVSDPSSGIRSIVVTTEPGATVWLDGVLYGTTGTDGSLTISPAPAGRKIIVVRAFGFSPARKTVAATQRGKVTISLVKTDDAAELAFQEGTRLAAQDREKAALAFDRAAKLRPGFTEAYIGLARLFSEMNDSDRTEKAVAEARKTGHQLAEASVIEGRMFKATGDEERAIASYKRSIREGAGFQPEAYTGLGMLFKERAENYGSSGEYERAAANYSMAAKNFSTAIGQLRGAPDAAILYQLLGLIFEQQKRPQEAIKLYQEFLRLYPTHPEADAIQSFVTQLRKQLDQQ